MACDRHPWHGSRPSSEAAQPSQAVPHGSVHPKTLAFDMKAKNNEKETIDSN